MFKASLEINQDSDIDAVVAQLVKKAASQNLAPALEQVIIDHFRSQVEPILERGKGVFQLGSTMSVGSTIQGDEYEIRVKAIFGAQKPFWRRLIGNS